MFSFRTFVVCTFFALFTTSAFAQLTAPAKIDLSYHFRAGTVLHYKRVDENRNPYGSAGYQGGNWDRTEDTHIAVEHVDLDGSTTLMVQNVEVDDFKGANSGSATGMSVSLAQDIPCYWVKVDRFGHFLSGAIVRRNYRDSLFHEKMKDPNFNGWAISDSEAIKLSLYHILIPRPSELHVALGMNLSDSTCEVGHAKHFALRHFASAPTAVPPRGADYRSQRNTYNVEQSSDEHRKGLITLSTHTLHYQVDNGTLISRGKSDGQEQFRTADGLPVNRMKLEEMIGYPSYLKRTLTLISVDSTTK